MSSSPVLIQDSDASSSGVPRSASRAKNPASGVTPLGALERYTLVAPLGRGGMAEVFLAAWEVEPWVYRPVVIKRLYDHFGDDPEILRMFLDEAQLVCGLDHENIVKTFEVGIIDGQCCIAMEYLAGQALRRLIRRTWNAGGLPIDLAVHIAIRVLEALEYAHSAQDAQGSPLEIVHRDISPHNIFVTNNGLVKVLDFGIAKAKSHEGRTSAGLIKGKFAYLAPEQANNQDTDCRADLWSLGVVLWEMLTGTRLFKADNDAATLRATLEADIPIVSTLRSEVHPELDRILWRTLQRNRTLRYRSASDMQQELLSYLSSAHCSPDKAALAALMRERFEDEMADQRRLVYELMENGGAAAANPDMPSISHGTSSASAPEMSSEMSRISSLVQELAVRHRTVLHTLLVALFVFVAVAAFFVCIFLVRFNLQARPSIQHSNAGIAPLAAASVVPQRPELQNEGKPTETKTPPAVLGAAGDDNNKTMAPVIGASVAQPAQSPPVPASNTVTESKARVPRTVRKADKSKDPLLNYGI